MLFYCAEKKLHSFIHLTKVDTYESYYVTEGLPRRLRGKPNCQCRRCGFSPWVREISWRRKWQPTPVFLLGKFHGQRSRVGYSPRGRKESDVTEHTRTRAHARTWACACTHTHTHYMTEILGTGNVTPKTTPVL